MGEEEKQEGVGGNVVSPTTQEQKAEEGKQPTEQPTSDEEKNWKALREKVASLEKQLEQERQMRQQTPMQQSQTMPFAQPQGFTPYQPSSQFNAPSSSPTGFQPYQPFQPYGHNIDTLLQNLPPLPEELLNEDVDLPRFTEGVRKQFLKDALTLQQQAIQPIFEAITRVALSQSELRAAQRHNDYYQVVNKEIYDELAANPNIAMSIVNSPDPGEALYNYARLKKISTPEAFDQLRKQIEQEVLQKVTAEKGHTPVKGGTSAGAPTSDTSMLDNATPEELAKIKKQNPELYEKWLKGE